MKQLFTILLALSLCAFFLGCNKDGKDGSGPQYGILDKDASYALGMDIGASLKSSNISPDINEFFLGIKDSIGNGKTRFTTEEVQTILQQAFSAMQEAQFAEREKENEANKQAGIDFLAENSKKTGVNITSSGLQYEVLTEGSGQKPSATDTVRVNYEGTLVNGTVFDSSYERGQPAEFPLNGVIAGWTEGIQLMPVGSKYKFYIPQELAYGEGGGGHIPPYSTLIFEVELLDIVK